MGIALALLAGGVVAFAQEAGSHVPLSIVVSIHPWADVVAQLGGERVTVATMLPAGASPHSFEPLPSQAAELAGASLVIVNGGVDGWLERLLAATAPNTPTLRLMSAVDYTPIQEVPHAVGAAGDTQDHAHAEPVLGNPHIWLDPTIVAKAVPVLAGTLSRLDPDGEPIYTRNAVALVSDLERVDAEISELFIGLDDTTFVPFHDAWGYFARRYGLRVGAILEPFAGREPSARHVADTVLAIRQSGVAVVFGERQLNDRTARVVAESAGVEVVSLDPLGGPPGPVHYRDILLQNAAAIAAGLRRQ